MQYRLLLLFVFSNLTGCLYYGDIHGNSKSLTEAELATPHVYAKPSTNPKKTTGWWNQFHDPQLNQLIDIAIQDSPNMKIAESRVKRAEYLAKNAAAPLWPFINLNGYVQRQRFSEFGLAPPPFNGQTFNIGDLALNFNYEFDFWGKNRENLAAAISEQEAIKADLAESSLIISAAVANTYFQLLSTITERKLAEDNAEQTSKISAIIADREKRGIESNIPVKTALANIQSAQLSVLQFRQTEALLKNQLSILLGKNPYSTKIITKTFVYEPYFSTLPTSLTANILANRPDIYAAKLRAEAAAHQIKVAKAGFFPDINLSALFSYQSIELNKLFEPGSQNNAITGAINLPIFDAGARRANLGIKYSEYDLAINQYNQTILTALKEVADQELKLKTYKEQLSVQKTALNATAHKYKLIQSRYNHGISDYLEVLQTKQLLLEQQATQTRFQQLHLQAVVGMLKALGGFDPTEG